MKIFEYLLNILSMENELIVVCVVQNKKSNLFQYSSSDEEGQWRRSAVCCTPDLKSLYKIRLNLQCPSTSWGGAGRGGAGRRWGTSPCWRMFTLPLPPSYLVLEVLIQNGEFYIYINMQKGDFQSNISDIHSAHWMESSSQRGRGIKDFLAKECREQNYK